MKRFVLLVSVSVLAACAGGRGELRKAAREAAPLMDREMFFEDPAISGGQLSPNGEYVSFVKPHQGVRNIWVKAREAPFETARPITADTKRPIGGYMWSRDSKYILYVQDKGGDENFRLYRVDPAAAAEASTGVPPAIDLTPYANVRAEIIARPKMHPGWILVGLNDRDPKLHDVYRVELGTGARTLIRKNDANVAGWEADLQGNLRAALRQTSDGGTEILRVDGDSLTPIYACNAEESCSVDRMHKDGRRAYLVTNKGSLDLSRLELLDLSTGKTEVVESDPQQQVDFAVSLFSYATDELIATAYLGDRLRVYPKDPAFAAKWDLARKELPNGDLYFVGSTADDRFSLVVVTSDVDPGAVYLFDRDSSKLSLMYRPYPKLQLEYLAEMTPIRYTARDGVTVSAYLTVPNGAQRNNLPAIVLPHGGPWARDTWGYDPEAQFLANRGYAVLQPNFRGSEGYGKKFLNLGNGQWGTGTMQHDLTDAAAWLVKQGIADPKRVGIMGGSYGGYATLAGLAFTPEVYAAGVDIVGPSNIVTLLNSVPPYWEPIKKMFAVRVGDMAKPEELARLKAQSPLYSARQIKSPLLVIQGANDPRVKQAESDQIVVAMRDLGRPVEYLVAADEGHGFHGRDNRIAMYAVVERFLGKHLGGRFQAEAPEAISKKAQQLTVDVATVKAPAPEGGGTKIPAGAP